MSVASTSPRCPGVTAEVELLGTLAWVLAGPVGSVHNYHSIRNAGDVCFSAPVYPLLTGNSGQTPVLLPGLVYSRAKTLSQPVPGEGVHELCFHP